MEEEKRCGRCGEIKSFDKFHRDRTHTDGRRSICKPCAIKYVKDRHNANPELGRKRAREWMKKNRFRRSLYHSRLIAKRDDHESCNATIEEIKAAFNGKCHVCGVPELELARNLHMDHDHETGIFRGWLCSNCNHALGQLKESREVILNLLLYKQRHETKVSTEKG